MSTKFNRSNLNAVNDQMHADDYAVDLIGVETDLLESLKDFHAPCIVSGLAVTNNSTPNQYVNISAGTAYNSDGHRIYIALALDDGATVAVTLGAVNYVCARYKTITSSNRIAYKTGVTWPTRIADSYEIVVRTEAQGILAGDVCLATTTGTGSAVTIDTDDRQQPDYSDSPEPVGPQKMTGLSVVTFPETEMQEVPSAFAFVDTPQKAAITVSWIPTADVKRYEIVLVPYKVLGGEDEEFLEMMAVTYDITTGIVRNECTFHSLEPGIRYHIRVRAIDTQEREGPWSEYIEIIAGITGRTQLVMSALTVATYSGAVKVTWPAVSGAQGYVLFATRDGSDPDTSDPTDIAYQGRGREVYITAQGGVTVKVAAICYDVIGWKSSNVTTGSGAAGTPS